MVAARSAVAPGAGHPRFPQALDRPARGFGASPGIVASPARVRTLDLDAADADALAGLVVSPLGTAGAARPDDPALAQPFRYVAGTVRASIGRDLAGTVIAEVPEPAVSAALATLVMLAAAAVVVLVLGVVWPV